MRLITPGNNYWWQRVLCHCDGNDGCEAEIEIEVGDLYKVFSYDSGNTLVTEYAVRCPSCKGETLVSQNLPDPSELQFIPERIQHPDWIWDYEYHKTVSDSMKGSVTH